MQFLRSTNLEFTYTINLLLNDKHELVIERIIKKLEEV